MRPINKLITIFFILLFITSACATAPMETSEKYDLADQLEQVSEILKFNFMTWEAVDNQSFVLQTAPSQFYLIVLDRPSERLLLTDNINISQTVTMVKAGFDTVTVPGAHPMARKAGERLPELGASMGEYNWPESLESRAASLIGAEPTTETFVIDKIFILRDIPEVFEIKDQLRGK